MRTSRACSICTRPGRGTGRAHATRSAPSPAAAPRWSSSTSTGRRDRRELPLPEVDEVYSPTWSPDGTCDRVLGDGRRLQRSLDAWTWRRARSAGSPPMPMPICSRPGRRTGRPSRSRPIASPPICRRSRYGSYRIALLDVASAEIASGAVGRGHQSSRSGMERRRLVVLRRRPRAACRTCSGSMLPTQARAQVTSVSTGVAGVTPVSPALSVARDTGAIAFSVFRNGGYEVHRMDAPSSVERAGAARSRHRACRACRAADAKRLIAPGAATARDRHAARARPPTVRGSRSKASGLLTSPPAADRSAATCPAAPRSCSAICSATIS